MKLSHDFKIAHHSGGADAGSQGRPTQWGGGTAEATGPVTAKHFKRVAQFSLVFLIFTSCSLKKAAVSAIGGMAWDGQGVLEQEEDVELARQNTPPLIIALDVLRQSHPQEPRYAALVAKAYGQYAYGFYEEDLLRFKATKGEHDQKSLERAQHFYERGRDVGLTALKRKKSFARSLEKPQVEFEAALSSFGKKDVSTLFWTAFSWGGWLNLHRDDPMAIIDLPRIEAMIDRVIELMPTYEFGAAHAFRGVMAASRPPVLGGKPEEAKASFEKAIQIEPRYLMTKLLYAQYYAVQVQDKKLFEQLLREVEIADVNNFPEQKLANQLAKRRADLLWGMKEKLF
ncbi:MAG: hypothetical protein A3C46_05640 [Deltaproteobacteria bacterium RIFCSPHIGHO2_02_FULL_44_16]|nr:MAG: hypothetical protein A3C46_05640 [Deltaproteobacteria bacterium RIFCSPHIGHO2_02_FULL_44_16]